MLGLDVTRGRLSQTPELSASEFSDSSITYYGEFVPKQSAASGTRLGGEVSCKAKEAS